MSAPIPYDPKKKKPQEIWNMITSYLPSLSARYASRTLQFQLDPSMEMNGKIWKAVFQNPSWINKLTTQHQGDPILLGASIEGIACGRLLWSSFSKHPKWVLLTGYAQQREFEKDLFLRCLQPHTYYEDLHEVHFTTGLVLNIQDVVYHSAQEIRLKPKELFSSRGFGIGSSLISYYVYWHEDPQVHTLTSDKILGVGGLARKFGQIDHTCEVTIDGNGNSYSHTFYDDDVDRYVRKLTDRNGVNLGWERTTRGSWFDRRFNRTNSDH